MFVDTDSARIHVDVLGNGSLPVLLLHGLGGSRQSWHGIAGPLARRRRVLAMDLRGCGLSSGGREASSLDLLADDAIAALHALRIDQCHLVGHSLGGVIAQNLLVRHGRLWSSAVLVSTSSRVSERASRNWIRLAESVESTGVPASLEASARGFSSAFAAKHPEVVTAHAELARRARPNVYAAQARAASHYDFTEALREIKQPVLVVQGLSDRLTPPGGSVIIARKVPHSRLAMIEDVGHNVPLELGSVFVKMLDDFFEEVERGGISR